MILFEFEKLYRAKVLFRPSKIIKSPYVADIKLWGKEEQLLGHSPALGCCGLIEKNEYVYVRKLCGKTKCRYQICLAELKTKGEKVLVGVFPRSAELIAKKAILYGLIPELDVQTLESEKKHLNSRFDYDGILKNGNPFICEVKNVPLADYADVTATERKKMDFSDFKYNDKIAYFPDGYRKKKSDPVSPRATKHINELLEIKKKHPHFCCVLLFIIQRDDASSFQPSRLDQTYLDAIRKASKGGVLIKTIQVKWRKNKAYYVRNDLPINL